MKKVLSIAVILLVLSFSFVFMVGCGGNNRGENNGGGESNGDYGNVDNGNGNGDIKDEDDEDDEEGGKDINVRPPHVYEFEWEVFLLTNIERENHGVPPLIWCDILNVAARGHAVDMEYHGMRGHIGSDGSTVRERIERAGLSLVGRGSSENMAHGQRTPAQVVAAWMGSDGHRANILLARSTHIGVGFTSMRYWLPVNLQHPYWVQKFVSM